MRLESLSIIIGIVVGVGTLFVAIGTLIGSVKSRQQKRIDSATTTATKPLDDKIGELREQIRELHDAQERVIDDAVALWKERALDAIKDRDYWRELANQRGVVDLEKRDPSTP